MRIKFVISFALSFIMLSCNLQNESALRKDPVVQKVFTQDEINSLEKILRLHHQRILADFPNEIDFVQAFKKHLKQLCDSINVAQDMLQHNYSEDNCQEIFDVLRESGLYDTLFPPDTLYVTERGSITNLIETDSLLVSRMFRPFTIYSDYLEALSETDTIYKYHYDMLLGFWGTFKTTWGQS